MISTLVLLLNKKLMYYFYTLGHTITSLSKKTRRNQAFGVNHYCVG